MSNVILHSVFDWISRRLLSGVIRIYIYNANLKLNLIFIFLSPFVCQITIFVIQIYQRFCGDVQSGLESPGVCRGGEWECQGAGAGWEAGGDAVGSECADGGVLAGFGAFDCAGQHAHLGGWDGGEGGVSQCGAGGV